MERCLVLPLLWQHPNSLLSPSCSSKGCRLSQELLIVLPWLLGLPLQELRRLLSGPYSQDRAFLSVPPDPPPTLEECQCFLGIDCPQ